MRRVARVLVLILVLGLSSCGGDAVDPHADPEGGTRHADPGGEEGHAEGLVVLSPEKLAEIEVVTAEARLRPLSPQLRTTGEVGYEQDRLAHVGPRVSGRVVRVSASLGDETTVGQALAVIDSVELGEAKARYLMARSRETVTRESYERELALFEDRISSRKEMLDARAEYLQAQAAREGAQETLRLYGLSGREVEALRTGEPGSSILSVRAPIAGRVVEKHVTVGELVTPEDNLFTIADLGHVWIWIDVFERDLASVHEGDGVEVRVDAFPELTFAGALTYLSSEVTSETRTVRARIEVDNSNRLLRPGMFADVRLTDPHSETGGAGQDVLTVPAPAVVRSGERGEREVVFEPLGEGRFRARPVETGRREGEWVEIVSGLAAGDTVVTDGSFFLKSELAREELGGGHGH
jgi:membrane fusion protein, heavy metal efflux system